MAQLQPSYTASGNTKWYNYFRKTWQFFEKLSTHLAYDPAIPLVDIHPRKMQTYVCRDLHTRVHTVALFITAQIWEQPKCLPTGESKEIVVYLYY